ncbi:hypothetical protein [uncultured Ruthenibacterium sp.]|uniref:DUF6903 family protein n=1 Tax=uncultured Ruthenibacterium sp. TaxID=1905347 RepID=UPI00349E590B
MNEYTRKKVKIAIGLLAFAACLLLVIVGHNFGSTGGLSSGIGGLVIELVGLAGVLVLLGIYNKGYQ